MLSIIIPKHRSSKWIEVLSKHHLGGLDHEIIHADNWQEGYKKSRGEFVCFLDPDCDFSNDYFAKNMQVFTSQSSFKRLAMVASAVETPKHKVYGYLLTLHGQPAVLPSYIRSSAEPYGVQIAYVPGAIIRRTMLEKVDHLFDDALNNSVRLSLEFWKLGSRCFINPETTFYSKTENIDLPFDVDGLPEWVNDLSRQFQREMIA